MNLDEPVELQRELSPGEALLWWGQPDPRRLFTPMDVVFVPFSLLWGGFAFFWEGLVLTSIVRQGPVGWFFALWGLPFVAMGCYITFGRFLVKRHVARRTWYGVTSKRVLSVSTAFRRSTRSAAFKRLPGLEVSVGRSGVGTITFGHWGGLAGMYANSGLAWFGWGWGGARPMSFFDVPDARRVYELIDAQSDEAS